MTVYENMSFGLQLKKVPKDEIDAPRARTPRASSTSPSCCERKPKQLSGGQRQRVAMGRAIVRDPKVFLFDEPLSNLDAKLRVQMRTEIKKVHQKVRTTTVYVTHDQVEAMTLADRVVVMNARPHRAGRHAERALPHARDQVRRRLHRLAGDELRALRPGGERRRAARAPGGGIAFPVPEDRTARYRPSSSASPACCSACARSTSSSSARTWSRTSTPSKWCRRWSSRWAWRRWSSSHQRQRSLRRGGAGLRRAARRAAQAGRGPAPHARDRRRERPRSLGGNYSQPDLRKRYHR